MLMGGHLFLIEYVFDGIHKRLPARGDDVGRHADRRPRNRAVGALNENADFRGGSLFGGQDTNLVVGQVDFRELGVKDVQRFPQRHIEGVDGAVAYSGRGFHFAVDLDAEHGRRALVPVGRWEFAARAVHTKPEMRLVPPENVEHHQFKTRVGRLKLVPLVLELLQPADDARRFRRIFVKAGRERRELREHGGSARDFAH